MAVAQDNPHTDLRDHSRSRTSFFGDCGCGTVVTQDNPCLGLHHRLCLRTDLLKTRDTVEEDCPRKSDCGLELSRHRCQ